MESQDVLSRLSRGFNLEFKQSQTNIYIFPLKLGKNNIAHSSRFAGVVFAEASRHTETRAACLTADPGGRGSLPSVSDRKTEISRSLKRTLIGRQLNANSMKILLVDRKFAMI